MKKKKLLVALLAVNTLATAQPERLQPIPAEKWVRSEAILLLQRFGEGVEKALVCPLYDTEGTNELFTEDATIQVTSLQSNTKKNYRPEPYWRALNGLICKGNAKYASALVSYSPTSADSVRIRTVNNACIATYDLTQTFMSFSKKNGARSYCDVTIKKVVMIFWTNSQGIMEGKIKKVYADHPEQCDQHAEIYSQSNHHR